MASSDDFPLIDSSSHLHAPPRPRDTIDSPTTANNGDFFPRPFPDDPDRSPNQTRTPNTKRSSYYYKKLKPSSANPNPTTSTTEAESSSGQETASQRGDYRKDREEWSDTAIACLLEAFTEKFNQLNRGNLRGRDWEEVAEMVSERCGTGGGNKSTYKTVEQCKNKIDNLKKRYKVELQRITSSGLGASHWHWFKKLEVILGSSLVPKGGGGSDEERSGGRANSNVAKQPKSMMATVMNSVLLQSALEKVGVQARVQTALTMPEVSEPYNRLRAIRHLEKGRVVIFGGIGAGTGNYLFTTDIAAALRASELNAEAVLKGTNFNGIYECHSGSNSVTVDHTCYREVVSRGITSVDVMALTYCEENGIPVVIFNLLEPGNISRALCGDQVGTLIDQAGRIG
ncbi:uridylate kinase-like isoform X2 [Prunus dulcis]|uniref:uridylate kinase-like isoform X2 n=1 Tax=Prunus dulcis TaxID=3755 RepID=UPI001482C6F3|nr:uridylate kinase-like isoform X2 [Prunus dulcis]